MAIVPTDTYPGQTLAGDPGYPQGKARNVTVSGDGTGTPLEATWLNDLWGFLQALLDEGDVTPSGDPDEVGASDYLTALQNALLRIRAANTITPTTITADVDDYEPTGWDAARFVRLNADAARSINGLKKSTTPKFVANISNFDLTLKHLDGGQAAGNQTRTPNGADYVLPPRAVSLFVHDATSDAWRVVGENLAAKTWTWTGVHDFHARVDLNAAGTALDVTVGDLVVSTGDVNVTTGHVTVDNGNVACLDGNMYALEFLLDTEKTQTRVRRAEALHDFYATNWSKQGSYWQSEVDGGLSSFLAVPITHLLVPGTELDEVQIRWKPGASRTGGDVMSAWLVTQQLDGTLGTIVLGNGAESTTGEHTTTFSALAYTVLTAREYYLWIFPGIDGATNKDRWYGAAVVQKFSKAGLQT